MSLKSSLAAGIPEWDPSSKEQWHLDFEKKSINDKKWSCMVTAAVPSEVQDQECIQIYTQCVSLGLRRAVKVITISDVIKVLKSSSISKNTIKSNSTVKNAKTKKEKPKPEVSEGSVKPISPYFQIVDLAAKYAVITDTDCKLPQDLMACVIKYIILNLKDEHYLQKRKDAVKERKIRERNIKAKFIRDLKPYERTQEETKISTSVIGNILDLKEPINDEPIDGPDLYILLVDFYDLYVFPELKKIGVPFLAILEVTTEAQKDSTTTLQKSDLMGKKKPQIILFWEMLKSETGSWEKVDDFKNIASFNYRLGVQPFSSDVYCSRVIFNELSWMLYSIYNIYRQHQKFLQQLHVQRLVKSLQPLDLSKCTVYNKLCDNVITGEPITPLLVLYSIIEQVVTGVPETESVVLEFQPWPTDFFSDGTEDVESEKDKKQGMVLVIPCLQCRNKKYEDICPKLKERKNDSTESGEWSQICGEYSAPSTSNQTSVKLNATSSEEKAASPSSGYVISESLLDQALSEKQTEKDYRAKKKWKPPSLCFYGDSIFLQTYHCNPRLFDSETIVERFLKNTRQLQIWEKFPEPPPMSQAFYNYHFRALQKASKEEEELLKLHIFFSLSMKLIGVAQSFVYKGEEDEESQLTQLYGISEISELNISEDDMNMTPAKNDFSTYFYKTFIRNAKIRQKPEKKKAKLISESIKSVHTITDSQTLHKAKSLIRVSGSPKKISELYVPTNVEYFESEQPKSVKSEKEDNKELLTLYALLDCLEITSLTHPLYISDKESFMTLVKNYQHYEKLEPHIMIQKLYEAQDSFNTTQSSYFPPTDSIIILMYNDFDHRGIFFTNTTQTLPTPVHFRDFYAYVYQEIGNWLLDEIAERKKFESKLKEKAKAEAEKQDSEYLSQLKYHYCGLSKEERKKFLETGLENESECEITENELADLPNKPKPPHPCKLAFVVTNFKDLRVENTTKLHEFVSLDGTKIQVMVESWLYAPRSLLRVVIKRLYFNLYYNQWLEKEIETSFTFKTTSDIIFSFYKSYTEDCSRYQVTISWPVGLIIQPKTIQSGTYIKQYYIKVYKKGWDIEDEASRCFIKNGQVIIFKEYGEYDILCPSGTKLTYFESGEKYEVTSMTGEIWEVPTKGRCRNRRNLLTHIKVYIGVDPKTQETFYKRDDGVYCMLWPNGTLVTNYPDGTKITTKPYFDKEVDVEWTEEEKRFLRDLQRAKLELSSDNFQSRSTVRNNSNSTDRKSCDDSIDEKFTMVSCSYLIEHPKYTTVFFNAEDDNIKLSLPEDVHVTIDPRGYYQVEKENDTLNVCETYIELYSECPECKNRTTTTLFLNDYEILCKCYDFFEKIFYVLRSGKIVFEECNEDQNEIKGEKSVTSVHKTCTRDHKLSKALTQRCFAFERDYSGVEFLQADSVAFYSDKIPDDTHYEINTDDPSKVYSTFTAPYYKVGYENWVMDYESQYNSLPMNLKKTDLKELGVKEVLKNLFKYPFPGSRNSGERSQAEKPKENVKMPKLIVSRTIRSWPDDPRNMIDDLQMNILTYQKNALEIWKRYKNHKDVDYWSHDSAYVMMKLRKIALTLNQSVQMYPHLCTQSPSTEKEIHYFGHFINAMADIKTHFHVSDLPDCKQIPNTLPRSSDFPPIDEESETPKST